LPAMTAMELEKALAKQKTEVDRDPTLSEAQKDRLGEILHKRYGRAMDDLTGRTSSIYDEE
jgi:hypothetical protein